MFKQKVGGVIVAGLLVSSLGAVAGCSSESSSTDTQQSQEQTDTTSSQETLFAIGTQSSTAKTIKLDNQIGKDISQVNIAVTETDEFGTALSMPSSQVWKNAEKAQISFEPTSGASAYDIQITCKDASVYTLHGVDVSVLGDDAAIEVQGDIAYLTYTSGSSTVSTLSAEQAYVQAQQEAADAAAAAEAAAAEQAQQAADAEAAAASTTYEAPAATTDTYSYDTGSTYSYDTGSSSASTGSSDSSSSSSSSGSSSDSSSVGQSGDGCVSGGVVLR